MPSPFGASSSFLSEQISHQQSVNSTFLSEQISTSHQPNEQTACQYQDEPSIIAYIQRSIQK
jgi:hypothetical protein